MSLGTFLTTDNTGLPDAQGSAAANGYTYLPGGMLLQWNTIAKANTTAFEVVFPVAFPNGALQAWGQTAVANQAPLVIASGNTTGANVTGASAVNSAATVFVIGY